MKVFDVSVLNSQSEAPDLLTRASSTLDLQINCATKKDQFQLSVPGLQTREMYFTEKQLG